MFDDDFMDSEFDEEFMEVEIDKGKVIADLKKIVALFSENQLSAIREEISADDEFMCSFSFSGKDINSLNMEDLIFEHFSVISGIAGRDSFEDYLFTDLRPLLGTATGYAFDKNFQKIEW